MLITTVEHIERSEIMPVQLELDNNHLQVIGLDKDEETKLRMVLSFQVQVFGAPKDQVRYRFLFNRKTKKTYAGLLPYVKKFLQENDIDYVINDNRVIPKANGNFSLVKYIDKEKQIKLEMRPYQKELVDACEDREIIQAATGAGKTFMMAALIAKYNVKPVCVFADKISLCTQLRDEISKFLGVEVGLVGDGIKDYKDITIISLQSAEEDYIKHAKLAMWDECLPYYAKITMSDGSVCNIGDIVQNHIEGMVLTYNTNTGIVEPKPITGYKFQHKTVIYIILHTNNDNEIMCTDNHKIWSVNHNRYIRADEINVGDIVQTIDTGINHLTNTLACDTIISKSSFVSTSVVYDIETADNHNFYADHILVSNCHHIPADTAVKVAGQCKEAYYRIGVSATPWRDTGDDMLIEAVLSKKKPQLFINASKLIELGYLIQPNIYFIPVTQVFKGKNYNDIYKKAIVENEHRNRIICKCCIEMYKRNKHILILIKNIEHGENLNNKLLKIIGEKEFDVTVKNPRTDEDTTVRVKNIEFLSGKDNTLRREAVKQAVREGKCRVLIASTIADEGLDLPILDTLILAGGGKSSTRAFQRIGRVIRVYEGKKKANVFDFTDYTPMLRRHSRERKKRYKEEPLWNITDKFVVNV